MKVCGNVPLSAVGQNSRKEKYVKTSIIDRNLYHLLKSVIRRVQEELLAFLENFRPPLEFNAFT